MDTNFDSLHMELLNYESRHDDIVRSVCQANIDIYVGMGKAKETENQRKRKRGKERSENFADHNTKYQLHKMVVVIIYLYMNRAALRKFRESLSNKIRI